MNNREPNTPMEYLYELYGRKPPMQAMARLETERQLIHKDFMDDLMLIAYLRETAKEKGSDITINGPLNGSFLAYIFKCTDVNPLPPHNRCPVCKKSCFFCEGDGWDLPQLECCNTKTVWDGHEIPVESVMETLKDPNHMLELRLTESFADEAVGIIRKHFQQRGLTMVQYDLDCLRADTLEFMLIPSGEPLPPLDENGIWHTCMDELYERKTRLITLVFDDRKERIRTFRAKMNAEPTIQDLLSEDVLAVASERIRVMIHCNGGTLLKPDKLCFSSLLKEFGYLHSSHTEENPVYQKPDSKYSELFSFREEVYDLIRKAMKPEYGISNEYALYITKKTRRGLFTGNRMKPETERVLHEMEIPDAWIQQMKETYYLPSKANLIQMLLDEMKITWYELNSEENSSNCRAGRFMLYKGELRPSDSYLETHTLPDYSPDDWYNDFYRVDDDEEVLQMKRVCKKCGTEFTIEEAREQFRTVYDWPLYTDDFVGDLCARCAIKETAKLFGE